MDRDAVFLGERDQHTALGGAVELGHHDAGDADDLAENLGLGVRVLPDGRVEHQQHRMRRRGVEFLHRAHQLLQLGHQVGLVLQTPGGVDEQHIGAHRPRLDQRVVGEARRVRTLRPGDDAAPGALAPDLQLLDRGGTERVAGGEHDPVPGIAILARKLADRRRLAAAVDADDEDHVRLLRRVETQRLHHRLNQAHDLGGERGAHLLGRHLLAKAGAAQRLDHLFGNADTHIASD